MRDVLTLEPGAKVEHALASGIVMLFNRSVELAGPKAQSVLQTATFNHTVVRLVPMRRAPVVLRCAELTTTVPNTTTWATDAHTINDNTVDELGGYDGSMLVKSSGNK